LQITCAQIFTQLCTTDTPTQKQHDHEASNLLCYPVSGLVHTV